MKKRNEIVEVVDVLIVSVVGGLYIGTREAHKMVVNGSKVKATATIAIRGTLMVRTTAIHLA